MTKEWRSISAPSQKGHTIKEELAEFIRRWLLNGLMGPKWTEGVAELVDLGMKAFGETYQTPELGEEITRLNRKLDEYHNEV